MTAFSPAQLNAAGLSAPYSCNHCGGRWGGLKTCHCTVCHDTFTTVTGFDRHRAGSFEPDERHCRHPSALGLVDAGRSCSCWGRPNTRHDDDGA
ncbi:FDXHR family putative zinc-binding protein [Mycobacterium sp.]|uniref:FDXHR family putative zinc-binding protein n=1 Tax=Mycobacterium sp. TaxID=1785 RepID=UPI003F9707FD